jgi:hypothetical protein
MPSLYDEAIADAKELMRMAEENAANRLIEAVAPRIRKIVEKRLTEATNEDDDIDSIVASLDSSGEESPDMSIDDEMDDSPVDDLEGDEDFEEEDEDFEDDADLASDSFSSSGGMASFPMKGVKKINIEFEGDRMLTDEGVELTNESINTLISIIDGKGSLTDRIREARMELKLIGRALSVLNEGRTGRTAALRIVENFNNILRKSLGFQGELNDIPRGKLLESSSSEMNLLLKEIKTMSTRSLLRTLLEREEAKTRNASSRRTLREADEDEDEDAGDDGADDMPVDDDGGDDGGDVDMDAVKSALESLAAAVGMEVKAADDAGDDDGGDEDDDAGGDEEISLEADEGSVYEMDEDMMEMEMEDDMEEMPMESRNRGRKNETVFNVNESQLRQELQRLRARRLREEIEPTSAFGGDPEEEFSSYDDVELNANVTEADAPKAKKDAAKAKKDASDAKKEAMEEARKNRALTSRLKEATAALTELRRELNEQKLFNAKLLYVNKLMQNAALPKSKLKAVVEALDSAKTLREANLLYKSLNESLSRTSSNLTEGVNRTVGRSSRSTRPGGMVNESVGETDRWAVLAGIGTKA